MSKTRGNWFTIDKYETGKIVFFFLLAGHLFRHAGARSAQQAATPPPLRQGEINFPAAHPTSLTAAVRRYGGGDGVAAAVVGRTVPRNKVSLHPPTAPYHPYPCGVAATASTSKS